MTIREIAELTGKGETSIRRWIECAKMADKLCAKMAEALNTKKAANFTLEETIEILRAGKISESLISILQENAQKKSEVSDKTIQLKIIEMMTKLMDRMDRLEMRYIQPPNNLQLEKPKDREDYIGEHIAKQIRAKNERRQAAQKLELYLFEVKK